MVPKKRRGEAIVASGSGGPDEGGGGGVTRRTRSGTETFGLLLGAGGREGLTFCCCWDGVLSACGGGGGVTRVSVL